MSSCYGVHARFLASHFRHMINDSFRARTRGGTVRRPMIPRVVPLFSRTCRMKIVVTASASSRALLRYVRAPWNTRITSSFNRSPARTRTLHSGFVRLDAPFLAGWSRGLRGKFPRAHARDPTVNKDRVERASPPAGGGQRPRAIEIRGRFCCGRASRVTCRMYLQTRALSARVICVRAWATTRALSTLWIIDCARLRIDRTRAKKRTRLFRRWTRLD